jgi:hypothetical protein
MKTIKVCDNIEVLVTQDKSWVCCGPCRSKKLKRAIARLSVKGQDFWLCEECLRRIANTILNAECQPKL